MVSTAAHNQDKIIKIIATSDVHGALFPKDYVSGKEYIPSMATFSSYVKQQRNMPDRDIILLDNGDLLQGDPIVYYYNYIDTSTKHIAAIICNYMQYDAFCMGNHDLEGGPNVYNRFNRQVDFPILSANIINSKTQTNYFTPYTIIRRANKKVAVIGLTTPKVPTWLPQSLIEDMEFKDMLETAKFWVKHIQQNEKPDVLVGLFHAGTDTSYNSKQDDDLYMTENASELVAKEVEGFDVVIAGHDHQGHNYTITNDFGKEVLIIAPTSRLKDFADITISFDENNNKTIEGKVYSTASVDLDYNYLRLFQPFLKDVEAYLNAPIGVIDGYMMSTEGIFGDEPMINLIHKVQLEYSGADISFAAPLSLNSYIYKGIQKRSDLFKLYKYDNFLYCMSLTGKEVKDYLEYSYWGWFNQMKHEDDYLIRYKFNNDGNLTSDFFPQTEVQSYNYDSAEGIIYTVDVSREAGNRINIVSMSNGEPFSLERKYKVAMTSYRGSGAGGLITEGAKIPENELVSRILTVSDNDIKYLISEWISNNSPVKLDKTANWMIIPQKWYEKRYLKEKQFFTPKNY